MSFVQYNTTNEVKSQEKIRIIEVEYPKKRNERCPYCKGKVESLAKKTITLKDFPDHPETVKLIRYHVHRYCCKKCQKTYTETIENKYPGTRITLRAAEWIKSFLKFNIPTKVLARISGIHWDTIRKIHAETIKETIKDYEEQLKENGYKPKYLAVDEFAIHRGHRYATCVMDLETGHVIWVGFGRTKANFIKFFEEFDLSNLSEVKAVAMDMNASYNLLVEKYLPKADIVYDRYHMQAQYGREVLGTVRLEEAREHKKNASEYKEALSEETDPAVRKQLREKEKEERALYSQTKKARWLILGNSNKLNEFKKETLQKILDDHSKLAICYAMKEEMIGLFAIEDPEESEFRWKEWFDAAKSSEIYSLKHFAELKEKRLPGLIAHARHKISTGKLEGLNNKIKVAKRTAYGFRNEEYFFDLIRFMTIPGIRC